MRRLVFALLMILTLSLNAQDKDVVKFMGIPVDGSKSEMISKLQSKGFVIKDYEGNEYLEGVFNGEPVHIFVHTNNNLVDRIIVHQTTLSSESNIKIKFNTLVKQFEDNTRYMNPIGDQYIGEEVDISYEMSVKSTRFQASFHQWYSKEEMDEIRSSINDNYDALIEVLKNSDELKEEGIIFGDDKKENIDAILVIFAMNYALNNDVWFMITNLGYDKYYISFFYDNLNNRPNGEDL